MPGEHLGDACRRLRSSGPWTALHLRPARAPHLDGRYTWIGRVHPSDLDLMSLLTVGDRFIRARVRVLPPLERIRERWGSHRFTASPERATMR